MKLLACDDEGLKSEGLEQDMKTVSSEAVVMCFLCVIIRHTHWTCLELSTSGSLLMEEQLVGGWGGKFLAVRPTICWWLQTGPSGSRSDSSATWTHQESLDGSENITHQSVLIYKRNDFGKIFIYIILSIVWRITVFLDWGWSLNLSFFTRPCFIYRYVL